MPAALALLRPWLLVVLWVLALPVATPPLALQVALLVALLICWLVVGPQAVAALCI